MLSSWKIMIHLDRFQNKIYFQMFIPARITFSKIKKRIRRMNQLKRAKVPWVTMVMMILRGVNPAIMKSLYWHLCYNQLRKVLKAWRKFLLMKERIAKVLIVVRVVKCLLSQMFLQTLETMSICQLSKKWKMKLILIVNKV